MNIYTILLSKHKCDSLFPKLPEHNESAKRKSKKKINAQNFSIDENKYRLTQQSIIK